MQELVLWGTHYVAGKHLLFSCMLTIFYKAENSHLNLIPFLLASLIRSNKARGKFSLKAGIVFKQGIAKVWNKSYQLVLLMRIWLKVIKSTWKWIYYVCYYHKGTEDNTNYMLTLCFLIAVLKHSPVPRKRNATSQRAESHNCWRMSTLRSAA